MFSKIQTPTLDLITDTNLKICYKFVINLENFLHLASFHVSWQRLSPTMPQVS